MKKLKAPLISFLVLAFMLIFSAPVPADSQPTVYKGLDYSHVYNYEYFSAKYPGIANKYGGSGTKILSYFVNTGMNKGRRGSAEFSVKSYRFGNADLRRKYGNDLRKYYLHYVKTGYKSAARRKTAVGITTMQNPLTVYEGIDYSKVYDYNYFIKKYPSVKSEVGDDDEAVLRYFVKKGMKKKMTGRNTLKYPDADPGSDLYQQLFQSSLYPEEETLPKTYITEAEPSSWNEVLLSVISDIENGGGYYTGSATKEHPVTTGQALYDAFTTDDSGSVTVDSSKARPSYCSSAVYLLMMRTLELWDKEKKIPDKAWEYLIPYTVKGLKYPAEADGYGCFGRANANGPGVAMLIKELGAGKNYYIGPENEYRKENGYWNAWSKAEPGDLLKIFRTKYIGTKESGHMVVYLGRRYALDSDGKRDDIIYYWSSQKSTDGYGIAKCPASEIKRGVLTKITDPSAFSNAKKIAPTNKNNWLASMIAGHNSTVTELRKHIA